MVFAGHARGLLASGLLVTAGWTCYSGDVSAEGIAGLSVQSTQEACSSLGWLTDDACSSPPQEKLLAALELPLGDNPVVPWPRTQGAKPKILILGDSFVATDFGRALQRLLNAEFAVDARRRGRSATGLARPDYFNWMSEGPRQVDRHQPDMVIVILGGNDGQDLVMASAKRGRVRWRSQGWEAEYATRVKRFIDALTDAPFRRVLWLGLPTMARPSLERKLQTIRAIQKHVVDAHPQGRYVDTSLWFQDRFGRIRQFVRLDKRDRPLRQEDGVHFSRSGAIWFAQRMAPVIAVSLVDG